MTDRNIFDVFADEKSKELYREKDTAFWDALRTIIKDSGIGVDLIFKNYAAFIRRRDMTRLLAHYELFKLVQDKPGSIGEIGVFIGAGLFTWSHLLEIFAPTDRARRVFGFDHFKGYQSFSSEDGAAKGWFSAHTTDGMMVSDLAIVESLVRAHDQDGLMPGVPRVALVPGDVRQTLPQFVKDNCGVRFSLINIDVNVYDAVRATLDSLYDLMVPGGIIAMTGFSSPPWEGEALALKDFFASRGKEMPELKKFPLLPIPRCYFQVPFSGSRS
jgi:hypothetical protein